MKITEDMKNGEVQHSLSSPEKIKPYNFMERTESNKACIWAVTMLLVVGIVVACTAGTMQRDNTHNADLTTPQVVQYDKLKVRGKRKIIWIEGGSVRYE